MVHSTSCSSCMDGTSSKRIEGGEVTSCTSGQPAVLTDVLPAGRAAGSRVGGAGCLSENALSCMTTFPTPRVPDFLLVGESNPG